MSLEPWRCLGVSVYNALAVVPGLSRPVTAGTVAVHAVLVSAVSATDSPTTTKSAVRISYRLLPATHDGNARAGRRALGGLGDRANY